MLKKSLINYNNQLMNHEIKDFNKDLQKNESVSYETSNPLIKTSQEFASTNLNTIKES